MERCPLSTLLAGLNPGTRLRGHDDGRGTDCLDLLLLEQ